MKNHPNPSSLSDNDASEFSYNFKTKSGKLAIIRYSKVIDAKNCLDFINTISLEDTFIRFSGEQLTLQEEKKYLESEKNQIEKGDVVKLFCFVDDQLVGSCDVHRDISLAKRKLHVGNLGLIIAKEFRGQGIGEVLLKVTLDQAWKRISDLKIIQLSCFANNHPALSLYKKLGFVKIATLPEVILYKDKYIDEVVMMIKKPIVSPR